ncbi:c8467e17-7770-4b76-9a4d-e4897e859b78 [Sclerotinia trifoliorum]|uniref:C8467e17-7770-4b76-9a4d-e4897e859b78 n=1 Tax=Sclerotinia trifoliorum TaxID=28548 RepID=A0A8H2VWS8_9HELO|nr:c8467e17-7770-4b76-9a4d-e4897e859b78 [Sclerotinia trifoliorum]
MTMVRPPAVIIVVRHGARLDQADSQWYLTTPTPYDPPLTYGGWTQSRSLGARIANILRSRETDDDFIASEDQNGRKYRKRRHKVIIHTSPFLRCVQTSVAISAGLAQNPGHTHHSQRSSSAQSQHKSLQMHSSPRVRPTQSTDSPRLAPLMESTTIPPSSSQIIGQTGNIRKSMIRVDAFLGEWLAPDYFEDITPPPSSIMMVAGAKADLLRREDYNSLIHVRDFSAQGSFQPFPGGWGSPITTDKKEFPSVSNLNHALPRRDRTSSLSSVGSNGSRQNLKGDSHLLTPEHDIYHPPVPSYAISTSDPIPPGYATHARDACVDVDYQWDSMREPLNWGSGGEYGEEWPSMHKRFRKGLQNMLGWYSSNENPGEIITKTPSSPELEKQFSIDDSHEEEDTDLVLILVTHGAGCNALIGALTNQPLLMDVGMASLTMAVRKPTPENTPASTPGATPKSHSRTNSKNLSMADEYDLKLLANTEHLRSSPNSTSSSQTPSITNQSTFRDRQPTDPNRSTTVNSSLGSIRRTASIASSQPRSYTTARQPSIGLWSATPPPRESVDENDDTDADSMMLNFGDDGAHANASIQSTAEEENKAAVVKNKEIETSALEEDEVAPLGLWGSPRLTASSGPAVDLDKSGHTPKRRWTVNERG